MIVTCFLFRSSFVGLPPQLNIRLRRLFNRILTWIVLLRDISETGLGS